MTDFFLELTPDRVLMAVENAGFAPTGHCTPLTCLENRVYDLRLEDDRHIVAKFYRPGRWTREAILEEHRFLADLREAEIPVCAPLPFPGGGTLREVEGIHFAMDYLTQQNKRNAGDTITDELITAKGKRVIIIGGGDTGSDCLGTVHRQGCVEAHQFELLSEPPPERAGSTPWPLWPMQLRTSHAHEEGCDRQWSVSTTKFTGQNGHGTKLHGHRVTFEGGKFTPIPKTDFEMDVDLVLLAMGFTGPVKNGLLDSLGVKYDTRGEVAVDENFMTNLDGGFAGGDTKRGASLIVWAIAEGRKMAAGVNKYLYVNRSAKKSFS